MNKNRKPYTKPHIKINIVNIESSIAAGSAVVINSDLEKNLRHEWDNLVDDDREIIWD